MTNEEWLDYMAHNDIPGLNIWFKAERVESPAMSDGTADGETYGERGERSAGVGTAAQEADSRERLEADAFAYLQTAYITYPQIIELLDRQAAITEREHPGLTISDDESLINWRGRNYLPQSRVLNAERERDEFSLKLKHEMELNLNNRNAHDLERIDELTAERDYYRSKFGKCLDYADAIHALMDDEGLA